MEIDDLSDDVKERILEKIREKFRFDIALMKSDMIVEIMSSLGGVPRHVGIEDGYEDVHEKFEVNESSGEDIIYCMERPIGTRADKFSILGS